ncbi:hypothetical protein BGZ51_005849 [Haplosporangium sp. Z 767]|nr:hypothetical protein BGZ51_005849 [Haplosporangium sp. Z 767]KAF9194583.1 hypothetical protein BGZ50_006096 [Haplosporangium sp. Z 11]
MSDTSLPVPAGVVAAPTKPHVLIVGAGLGGLMMGILLERAGIPYDIFERAAKVKPLGALMSIGENILPAFEQLGLLEAIEKIALPLRLFSVYKETMEHLGDYHSGRKEKTGYELLLFPRPKLYEIMLEQVPAERLHFSKKVLSMEQKPEGVMIRCADNTTYRGDILVGADGAYSGVRQSLYKRLSAEGKLSVEDGKDLEMGYVCMVGTTDPQDPEKYPMMKTDHTKIMQVAGENSPYTWTTICVAENRICWSVVSQLPSVRAAQDERFRNSEWGPEANEAMIKEIHNFPTVMGGTLGDLIDATPRDLISKVFLEEKMFQTWYHGRTALIGDAVHKMLPTAGQGAVNAMQDAVILTNCIYHIPSVTPENITEAFKAYQEHRYPHAKMQFDISRANGKIMSGQTWTERLIRTIVLNYIPQRVLDKTIKGANYRPQICFLPEAKVRGTIPVLPQMTFPTRTENTNAATVVAV